MVRYNRDMEVLLVDTIILIAFFFEALFGFGGGLLAIPSVSVVLPVKTTVNLVLIFQLLIGILIVRTWKDTDWAVLRRMLVGLILGAIVGSLSLSIASDVFLRRFLAVSVLVFLVKMLFFPKATLKNHKNIAASLAGFMGAYFQGIIGIGGPIFTMYLLTAVPNKQKFRATLIFMFFLTSILRLGLAIQGGFITETVLAYAIPLIIPFVLVVSLGQRLHWKIPDTYYRYAVYAILLGSSLSLLLK